MKNSETFCKLTARDFKRLPDAEVYFCRFANRSGWAMAILHEATGTVAIHSDYGDWVYSWPAPGRGTPTLKEFLCGGSYDYLACKFEQGRKEKYDHDATVRKWRDTLLAEAQDEKPITWNDDRARAMVDWLEEEAPHDPALLIERLTDDWKELLGENAYEELVYDREPRFYWLRDGVLPALVDEIKKTLPAKVGT